MNISQVCNIWHSVYFLTKLSSEIISIMSKDKMLILPEGQAIGKENLQDYGQNS
jgi:hypothetical protein